MLVINGKGKTECKPSLHNRGRLPSVLGLLSKERRKFEGVFGKSRFSSVKLPLMKLYRQ